MNTVQQKGFTLFELLVAAAIFALMGALAYGGLNALIEQRRQGAIVMDRMTEIQRGFTILSRDVLQARNRSVREPYHGDPMPPLRGADGNDYALELTRGGWRNPLGQARSNLQRVAYRIESDGLVRYNWLVLDQAQDSVPVRTVLIEDATRLAVRYLDADGEWQSEWPPFDPNTGEAAAVLPRGIEIGVDLEDWGRITRLYEVAGG